MPTETDYFEIAESLIIIEDTDARQKIDKLNSSERKAVFIALIEKHSLSELVMDRIKIKKKLLLILKSKMGEINTLIDLAIQRYKSVAPDLVLALLDDVIHLPSVIDHVNEMGYLEWVVSRFTMSGSYDEATNSSQVIKKIWQILPESQIQVIFNAILENSQIYDSWGAKRNLVELVEMHWEGEESPFILGKKRYLTLINGKTE